MNTWKNIAATLAVLFAMNGTAAKLAKQNKPIKKDNNTEQSQDIQFEKNSKPIAGSPICRGGGGAKLS